MTVYSAQGSQAENVHVHAKLFKGERNLLYTACTRAMKKLKISGIALDDDGIELTTKMELHPKSVLWQVDLGVTCFSPEARAQKCEILADRLMFRKLVVRAAPATSQWGRVLPPFFSSKQQKSKETAK